MRKGKAICYRKVPSGSVSGILNLPLPSSLWPLHPPSILVLSDSGLILLLSYFWSGYEYFERWWFACLTYAINITSKSIAHQLVMALYEVANISQTPNQTANHISYCWYIMWVSSKENNSFEGIVGVLWMHVSFLPAPSGGDSMPIL